MAPVTRSKARASGLQLLTGVSGVSREPKYKCIICTKRCSTKPGLMSHFKTHKAIPVNPSRKLHYYHHLHAFTDPSCWPQEKNLTWDDLDTFAAKKRELELRELHSDATAAVQHEWKAEWELAEAHAKSPSEIIARERVKELRVWKWWYQSQVAGDPDETQMAVDGRLQQMLESNGEDFDIIGDSGAQDQKIRLKTNTFHIPPQPRQETAIDDEKKTISLPDCSFISLPRPDYAEHWGPWRDRGRNGRVATDCELPLRGPLNSEAILECLSEANTSFVGREGETNTARAQLANAVAEYIDHPFPDDDDEAAEELKAKHAATLTNIPHYRDWRAERDMSRMGPGEIATRTKREELWYAQRFREARAGFFDTLSTAISLYFNVDHADGLRAFERGNGAFNALLEATDAYARALGDKAVRKKLDRFRTENGKDWRAHLNKKYGWGQR